MAGRRIDNAFLLLLYPDEDPTHKKAMEMLRKGLINTKWEYYAIEHDKDVYTKEDEEENPERKEGEKKKAHTHVVLFTHRKMATSTLADTLQIPKNYTSYSNDVDGDLEYLTHGGPRGEGKYKYTTEAVETNSKTDYITRISKEASRDLTEEEKLEKVMDIIDGMKADCLETGVANFDFDDVLRKAMKEGLGTYVQRNHQSIDKSISKANVVIQAEFTRRREIMKGFEPLCDDQISPFEEERK